MHYMSPLKPEAPVESEGMSTTGAKSMVRLPAFYWVDCFGLVAVNCVYSNTEKQNRVTQTFSASTLKNWKTSKEWKVNNV